jgi:hypothetical protein
MAVEQQAHVPVDRLLAHLAHRVCGGAPFTKRDEEPALRQPLDGGAGAGAGDAESAEQIHQRRRGDRLASKVPVVPEQDGQQLLGARPLLVSRENVVVRWHIGILTVVMTGTGHQGAR